MIAAHRPAFWPRSHVRTIAACRAYKLPLSSRGEWRSRALIRIPPSRARRDGTWVGVAQPSRRCRGGAASLGGGSNPPRALGRTGTWDDSRLRGSGGHRAARHSDVSSPRIESKNPESMRLGYRNPKSTSASSNLATSQVKALIRIPPSRARRDGTWVGVAQPSRRCRGGAASLGGGSNPPRALGRTGTWDDSRLREILNRHLPVAPVSYS